MSIDSGLVETNSLFRTSENSDIYHKIYIVNGISCYKEFGKYWRINIGGIIYPSKPPRRKSMKKEENKADSDKIIKLKKLTERKFSLITTDELAKLRTEKSELFETLKNYRYEIEGLIDSFDSHITKEDIYRVLKELFQQMTDDIFKRQPEKEHPEDGVDVALAQDDAKEIINRLSEEETC